MSQVYKLELCLSCCANIHTPILIASVIPIPDQDTSPRQTVIARREGCTMYQQGIRVRLAKLISLVSQVLGLIRSP